MLVASINRFFRQSLMSFKSLFGWLDPKIYLLVKVIDPIFQLLFFCLLARYVYNAEDITPWVIGNAFLLCTKNAIFGVGHVLVVERFFGTLKVVVATPSNKFLVFISRGLMHIIDSLFTVFIGLVAGVIFFGISFSGVNIPLFFLVTLVAMLAATSLGLLLGCFGLWLRDMNLLMNTAAMGLLALSGANFPLASFPPIVQRLSYSLPITRSIEAARLLMTNSDTALVYRLMSQEILLAIVYTIAGYILLKLMENLAKRSASLDVY